MSPLVAQLFSILYRFLKFLFLQILVQIEQERPPLPLLRLPQLAYKNVIDMMTACEQVTLSLCSRKTYAIVKNTRHRPKSLELWLNEYNLLDVATGPYKTTNSKRNFSALIGVTKKWRCFNPEETVMIKGNRVHVRLITDSDGKQFLGTFWEDENTGLRTIADYVCDLFRVDLFCVMLENDHRRMFDWLRNRQSFVNIFGIGDRNQISDEDYCYGRRRINAISLL
uniref:F-box domain-containing protein n=1 Tax=Caenorhabditis tropicalis TaxID=1561998 RepID=A0A1I7T585_9PELO